MSSFKPIKKAVFPVAGLGTRFLPATKAIPKELLPIIDRPLIQYAFDEAREAGIEQMIFVTGRGKTAIVEHFDTAFELESILNKRKKKYRHFGRNPNYTRSGYYSSAASTTRFRTCNLVCQSGNWRRSICGFPTRRADGRNKR